MSKLIKAEYVLLTGATSGIGSQIAVDLDKAGYALVLASRSQSKAEILCNELVGKNHLIWEVDLSDVENIERSFSDLLQKCSVIGFIHAAGVFSVQPIRICSPSSIRASFNVNVFAAIEIIRHLCRPRMNSNSLRNIIFISSISSQLGFNGMSIYSASKGSLISLSRSLAVELAPGVRVNCISPGAILTDGTRFLVDGDEETPPLGSDYPLGPGCPSDISNVASFLLSEKSRWITGQNIIVDGGRTLI